MAAPKQGGFKMSLGALKAKPGLKASPTLKDTKKPRLLLGDDEPDDSNKQQEITGWDAAEGGALDASGKKEKEGPRIIPALPNRDWRAEARRKQLAKAPHQQAQNGTVDEKQMEEPKVQYGLTIIKMDEVQENGAAESDAPEPMEVEKDNLTDEQRLEKKALDALINGKSTDGEPVIPVQTEEEAFLNDLHNAPDAPTLEAYEATPIEGFGAALLRGMGWKDGEAIGKNGAAAKPKEVKRRPALLGIGAKEEAAVGIELGEWGGGKGKGKGKKVAQSYNPVTLRNKHTGEMITEEELKAKLEQQDMVQEEKPSKEKSKYNDDSEEDDRRREKRRGKKDERDRDRDRDRDYDSERKRDKDRRRDKEDYYDSDRRRDRRKDDDYDRKDKHRDRARDDDYDSERKRDKRRERSRSPDERKQNRRDRYRSRSRSQDIKRKSDRRERSRSRDSDKKRKRRREREYDDEREDRKKRHRDDMYYK